MGRFIVKVTNIEKYLAEYTFKVECETEEQAKIIAEYNAIPVRNKKDQNRFNKRVEKHIKSHSLGPIEGDVKIGEFVDFVRHYDTEIIENIDE